MLSAFCGQGKDRTKYFGLRVQRFTNLAILPAKKIIKIHSTNMMLKPTPQDDVMSIMVASIS
jgi:hypothetical protein